MSETLRLISASAVCDQRLHGSVKAWTTYLENHQTRFSPPDHHLWQSQAQCPSTIHQHLETPG